MPMLRVTQDVDVRVVGRPGAGSIDGQGLQASLTSEEQHGGRHCLKPGGAGKPRWACRRSARPRSPAGARCQRTAAPRWSRILAVQLRSQHIHPEVTRPLRPAAIPPAGSRRRRTGIQPARRRGAPSTGFEDRGPLGTRTPPRPRLPPPGGAHHPLHGAAQPDDPRVLPADTTFDP
jgi:hypothetical protein